MPKNQSLVASKLYIQFHPNLALMLGSVSEALVIQTMVFALSLPRSGKVVDGHRWIWNTYEQWQDEWFPFWGCKTIKRTLLSLEEKGLLVSAQLEGKMSRMKSYRVPECAFTLLSEQRFEELKDMLIEQRDHGDKTSPWYGDKLYPSHGDKKGRSISEKTKNIEDTEHIVSLPQGKRHGGLPKLEELEKEYSSIHPIALCNAYYQTETQIAKGKRISAPKKYALALARKIEADFPPEATNGSGRGISEPGGESPPSSR